MTRVSVIIPAYNTEATLARTVRTVLAQTHRELEVFVVDDGSTDKTRAIADEIAGGDPRLTVLHQPNAGVAAARNLALDRASGEFVAWLDADDLWHPAKIEKQLAVFRSAPPDTSLVYTGYRLVDRDDRVIRNFRTLVDVSGHTLCRQIATNFFSNVSSIMVPTELARRLGGHDPRLRQWGIEGAEDLLLQLQLATAGAVQCCREALVGYRMHNSNMSLHYDRAARSNLQVVDLIAAQAPEVPKWVIRLGRARTVGYALHMASQGAFRDALRLAGRLVNEQPGYALLTLALILHRQARVTLGRESSPDPCIGMAFADADPASAPWEGHMVLTRWHERLLARADATRLTAAPARIHTAGPKPA